MSRAGIRAKARPGKERPVELWLSHRRGAGHSARAAVCREKVERNFSAPDDSAPVVAVDAAVTKRARSPILKTAPTKRSARGSVREELTVRAPSFLTVAPRIFGALRRKERSRFAAHLSSAKLSLT